MSRLFVLPETPVNRDRQLDLAFARKWATVIREWSDRYGDAVSGWWFDGGYEWIGFNSQIARVYAEAAKHGNAQAVVTFNPGVSLKRWTDAEDYTAGELNDPFTYSCNGRWLDGSQWHALTFLGDAWDVATPGTPIACGPTGSARSRRRAARSPSTWAPTGTPRPGRWARFPKRS